MATTLVDRTLVAIGHGHQPDAFQRGREAAQTAKSQLLPGPADLVLTFGPDNVHFKDLIEGVRLVTGEETLIGIPVQRVISKDSLSSEASIVLAIQSRESHFSFGAAPVLPGQYSSVTTNTFSQIRSRRGNIRKQFAEQGFLVFDNAPEKLSLDTHRLVSAEAGLATWTFGVRPRINQTIPLVCGDKSITEGLVAIECLSASPWGIGQVILEEFKGQGGNIYLNAIKTALRDALAGMLTPPSFGLLFLNFPIDTIPSSETDAFFEIAGSVIGDIPFVGLGTDHVLIRGPERFMTIKNHAITVLLGPPMKIVPAIPNYDPARETPHFFDTNTFKLTEGGQLLMDPEFLGRLRRELLWTLGSEAAAGVFTRLGYSCGTADVLTPEFRQPIIRGLGQMQSVNADNESEFILNIADSCESKIAVKFNGKKIESPQCWMLSGYLTGIVSAHVGYPIVFVEMRCAAGQHTVCHFVGKPQAAWGDNEMNALSRFEEDNIHKDLLDVCEQLQLTRDRYQNLFEHSSVPMFIVDPDSGAFLDVNIEAQNLTSYPRENLLRMTLFDLCLPKEHFRILDQMKALMQAGTINDCELPVVQKDGSSHIVMLSLKLLAFGSQKVIQTIMRDVTALKIAEQKEKELQAQLLRSERLSSIGHLAASVAHELKNPLGAIKNAVYYIKNALVNNPLLETDPHLSEIMKLIDSEIDSSVTIIGELLDFSRVVTIAPRKTSLNELVEELPSLVQIPDNVKLVLDLDPQIPTATVDPERLRQVFTNIASNALQAMPQGGTLTLQTRLEVETSSQSSAQTKFIFISIEDTGQGIAPRHITKIFEPLFTTKARGTGLGLAISNNIVQKHGGVILVTSQEGKGARFSIKLPLAPPPDKEEE